jgi:hypothetical protein
VKLTIKHNTAEVQKAFDELPQQIERAATSAGAALAQKIAQRIREMVPKEGGWFDVYRRAIDFIEISPTEFGIAGTAELPFDQVEADKSLLWFQGGDQAAQVLGQYNPWTIDAIPAVKDGISSDILVRPASESEVGHHRVRLKSHLKSIELLLTRVGSELTANGLPSINGRVMADLDFLTRRLEFGLGGFPRTPIWTQIEAESDRLADSPSVKKAFDDQVTGSKPPPHSSK